jgi:hypothetical protein
MITEIAITPVSGIILGVLYDVDETDYNYNKHNIEILFFIFSINFIWMVNK